MKNSIITITLLSTLFACNTGNKPPAHNIPGETDTASFGRDVTFFHQHLGNMVLLQSPEDSSMVIVAGDYQARVMTSSARGLNGKSYGWINYALIDSGGYNPHINAYGGEERFWLGPEGGQYALFFPPGKPFEFQYWQTPGLIDTASFDEVYHSGQEVLYSKQATLQNYAGFSFDVSIRRRIRLLKRPDIVQQLGMDLPSGLATVAYQTENTLINSGKTAWKEDTGLLSIWLLGMFTPSDKTVIAVPFKPLPAARDYIHDDYFGKISPAYLQVKDSLVLMKADGRSRGKIGLAPEVALPMAGSVDTESGAITLILFSIDREGRYVNSKWEQQQEPYRGDVVNCYNDGPLADGKQMGPFYELESSSAARPLQPGDSTVYRQTTVHLEGDRAALDSLAQRLWHMSIKDIASAFDKK
jgi:hypothetical protein